MNIYVCGNPLVKIDALPLRLLPALRKKHPELNFIEFDPSEDFPKEEKLMLIDTVINAKDVQMFDNIDQFAETKAVSLHDFDLGTNLKLAKKMGWVKKVIIIGVPPKMKETVAVEKISKIITTLSLRNAQRNSCRGHMP